MEELELVQGLRERNDASVELFLQRYRSLFFHCIGHFESEAAAREDLLQEIIVYVLERIDQQSYDPAKGSLGTWLYRVAWCRCVDLKRRDSARKTTKLATVGEKVPERADPSPTPGETAGDEEMGTMVRKALAQLEPEERALLQQRFVDGRTIQEISEAIGISTETVKYRLKRASTSMRRVLLNDFAVEDALR